MYSSDGKAEFSASLLQSLVSHDASEIILIWWFAASGTFLIINNVIKKTVELLNIFVATLIIFSGFFDE